MATQFQQGGTGSGHLPGSLPGAPELTAMATLYREIKTELAEQERVQQALRENTEKFRNLFDSTSDAVFIIDPVSDAILDANPMACKMLGYTRKNLLALPISGVHPDDMDKLHALATQVAEDGVGWTNEITCTTKDGLVLPTEISASAIGIAGNACMIALIRDLSDKIEAEKELRQSQVNYHELYDNTPVMMHSIDSTGLITSVNKHWLEVMGYDRSEVIGLQSVDFLTDESRASAVDVGMPAALKVGFAREIEYQMVKKNGELIDVLISARHVGDGEDRLRLGFLVDITERKRTEEALRESEEEARLLAHECSVMAEIGRIVSASVDINEVYDRLGEQTGKLVRFDHMSLSLINHEKEISSVTWVFGQAIPDRGPGDIVPLAGGFVNKVVLARAPVMLEVDKEADLLREVPRLLPAFSAGMRSFLGVPLFYHDDLIGVLQLQSKEQGIYSQRDLDLAERVGHQIAGSIANSQLYADLKRADEALRKSEERYRDLYEHTPVMMHSLDSTGLITSVNEHWLDVMGYDRGGVIGRRSVDFVTEASRVYAIEVGMPAALSRGFARDVPYQMVKKDGEVIDVLISARHIGDGEDMLRLGFVVDVTERNKTENMLIEQMQQRAVLEERNRIAREIHDTLAQSLLGTVINLEVAEGLLDTEPAKARSTIEQARRLTRESLEEARRSVWDLRPLMLETVGLSEAIQLELNKIGDSGVSITFDAEGKPAEELDWAGELALLRTVQEGLSNVAKHSQATMVDVRLIYEPDGVKLCVEDDGVGFDPTSSQGILSPTGGGFGLTSMRERARLIGGRLEVKSGPGSGTQVDVWVPYQAKAAEPAALTPIDDGYEIETSVNRLRVFVADDHEVVREGLRNMLSQVKDLIVVGEASDGESAVQRIKDLIPDVVLLDIQMPDLDGVETLKRMRQQGILTPVILLSTYAKDEYIFEGLRAGANGYLVKDVGREELAQAIRTVHAGVSLLQPLIATRIIQQLGAEQAPDLTEREAEILDFVATGARNKEIADQMMLSERTVRFHIANLFQKLEVQSRTQAVSVARQRGILS